MRSLLCLATLPIIGLAADAFAQKPDRTPVTKAMYMVTGLHWGACATTLEGSLKKTKGVKSIKVDFRGKSATTEFDESVISAQEVARAMSGTPHMMGRDMQYGGILLLSVAGVNDEATGKKATAALSKVEGVAKVTLYPKHQAVGIEFKSNGKVTSKRLIDALEAGGLKGTQYGMRSANGATGQAMNGGNGFMPDHAGMAMGNGGMPGPAVLGVGMGCCNGNGSGAYRRGGCGCCR